MARRVTVDYSYAGFGRGMSRRKGRWPVLIAVGVGVALLLVFGLTEGRSLWHAFRLRTTSSSHALTAGQLGGLKTIANPAATTGATGAVAPANNAGTDTAPAAAVLPVPYSVQAPANNWKIFENACEEDAVLMYHQFLAGDSRTDLPVAEVGPALRAMQQWQVTNWGAEKDLTIDKTGQLAQAYYGYHYEVVPATQESITAQIASGHPVIVPVMTHSLQNPHYGPNTVYHEVLIKGYNAEGVVANDGGVKEGKNWFYKWSVLWGAIDAQTPKMGQGRVGLVLTK
jgi:hypothetical protein